MQGTGKTYEVSGETTEWEDILIKKGITTKEDVLLGKGLNPEDFLEKTEPDFEVDANEARDRALESLTLDEMDELEEEAFSDSRALDEYRSRRLQELRETSSKNRFGDVLEISKDDWIREVTEGSKSCWVVTHLYQDSVVGSRLLDEAIVKLAAKFRYIKFCKIRATSAVENWPERNLPTLFLYFEGVLAQQLITLRAVGGNTMTVDDLEWWLVQKGVITTSELEDDPRADPDFSHRSVFRLGSPQRPYAPPARGRTSDDEDDDT